MKATLKASALQIAEDVRGEHDGGAAVQHLLDKLAEKVAPAHRVEAGHGFIEHQQIWPGASARTIESRCWPPESLLIS